MYVTTITFLQVYNTAVSEGEDKLWKYKSIADALYSFHVVSLAAGEFTTVCKATEFCTCSSVNSMFATVSAAAAVLYIYAL